MIAMWPRRMFYIVLKENPIEQRPRALRSPPQNRYLPRGAFCRPGFHKQPPIVSVGEDISVHTAKSYTKSKTVWTIVAMCVESDKSVVRGQRWRTWMDTSFCLNSQKDFLTTWPRWAHPEKNSFRPMEKTFPVRHRRPR